MRKSSVVRTSTTKRKRGLRSKATVRVKSRDNKKRRKLSLVRRSTLLKPIINATEPIVSVVIPVMNERGTLAQVIRNTSRIHPQTEVIVVINGSSDGSERIARRMGAKVIRYTEALGHDVGRSIGANEARGNIILFVDGDFIIPTHELVRFITAIEQGMDIALNGYSGPTEKLSVHNVVAAKHALNVALSRTDLKGSSMTTVPHAISRRALEVIGASHIAVPPLAQAMGIHYGLHVGTVPQVNVGPRNPKRRRRRHGKDPLEKIIIGDHLEAIHWRIMMTNDRGNHTDLDRKREEII